MPPETFTGLTNAGLAGMLFYMWYMQSKKETALQDVIKEEVEDKKLMREDRATLIGIIREQAQQNIRIADALQRVEIFLKKVRRRKRLPRKRRLRRNRPRVTPSAGLSNSKMRRLSVSVSRTISPGASWKKTPACIRME